jgi:hypothetical protein
MAFHVHNHSHRALFCDGIFSWSSRIELGIPVLAFNALAGAETLTIWNGKWTAVVRASTVQTGARGMAHMVVVGVFSVGAQVTTRWKTSV